MDRCDPRSRPLATNRAAHRAEKISAAYRNPRHRRQGIPGLRCRATPNTANLLSENRPRVTAAGVSLRRLTSRNSLTLKTFPNAVLKMGMTDPSPHGLPCRLGNLELNGPLGLLLQHHRPRCHGLAVAYIPHPQLYEVTGSKLAVDG